VDRPLRAGFLLVDGVFDTELVAPLDVLEHAGPHTRTGVEAITISPDGKPVTTAEGLRIVPHHGFADAPPLDILVVPSAEESRGALLEDRDLLGWLAKAAGEARFIVGLCWGSFVLAEAGLLDGRSATTFPADYDRFGRRYPDVHVRVNVSFVHDGRFLTSQGGVPGYDVAMYLVDLLYGPRVAKTVGAGLLIPWPPDPDTGPAFVSDPAFLRGADRRPPAPAFPSPRDPAAAATSPDG
jgi:transcriptional regulator GlxA family with amidase domain